MDGKSKGKLEESGEPSEIQKSARSEESGEPSRFGKKNKLEESDKPSGICKKARMEEFGEPSGAQKNAKSDESGEGTGIHGCETGLGEAGASSEMTCHNDDPFANFVWPTHREGYKLEEIIGSGSTSIVYRSVCIEREASCAIKRINLETYDLARLDKEIRSMNACRHRNIVRYYTSFCTGNIMWIVMRLLDRGSLRQILDREIASLGGRQALHTGVLSQPVIATVANDVLTGLAYIHDHGIIHGDVKSSNIVISSAGNVQLADFGPSVWVESEERTKKSIPGAVCYLAPEIAVLHEDELKAGAYTTSVDIWSLGIITLEMIAGFPPYHNKVACMAVKWIRHNNPPNLNRYESCEYSDYGRGIRHFLSSCLKKTAQLRWSAKKLLTHPFLSSTTRNGEYLAKTLLGLPECVATTSSGEQSTRRQLPPITDIPENLENPPVNVEWDFGSDAEEEHRINRINRQAVYAPVRVLPGAEMSMSISVTRCGEEENECKTILSPTELFYNCRRPVENQLFQLVQQRKLEPRFMVIVAASLRKIVTAAQVQNLEGKYFAFVIENDKKLATVLEVCITTWCYVTDHRH